MIMGFLILSKRSVFLSFFNNTTILMKLITCTPDSRIKLFYPWMEKSHPWMEKNHQWMEPAFAKKKSHP